MYKWWKIEIINLHKRKAVIIYLASKWTTELNIMPLSFLILNTFHHLSIQFTVTSLLWPQKRQKHSSSEMLPEHKPLQILHSEILKISSFMLLLQNHIHGFLSGLCDFDEAEPGRGSLADTESIESVQFYGSRRSKAAECSSLTDHIQTSALPWILSGASASDCHSHTHSLFIFTSARRSPSQVSICHPSSFISQKIPFTFSIYFTDTFSSPFCSFFLHPTHPPIPLLSLSSEAIILLPFSLYLHDTEVLSEAGADGKRQAFTKWFRFNIFPLLFITTQELHSRTNSPLVIALSFCKYHGPSLIFILLPPLSLRTPSVDQYRLGLRASQRASHIIHPCPAQNTAYETQRTSSVWHKIQSNC